MKKLISALITASMLAASFVMPVFADYTEADYDVEIINNNFDTETNSGAPDGTSYKIAGDADHIWDKTVTAELDFTKDFFLSVDFKMTSADQVLDFKSENGKDQGPHFTLNKGTDGKYVFRTDTSSTAYQNLYDNFELNQWYRMELEGKMIASDAKTCFRLYKYNGSNGELVSEVEELSLRNFKAGNSKYSPGYMIMGEGVCYDNEYAVQEYPNAITLSALADEIKAGSENMYSYEMSRNDKSISTYPVEWSVYNEADTEPLNDDNISISEDGKLSVGISAPTQTVTIRATAEFGGKELYGSKKAVITAVDTSEEVFDNITLSGPEEVKAGTSAAYTVTASKNGAAVTPAVDEVVWGVYDKSGVMENGDSNISISNGMLTVKDGTVPYDITVRASSVSGLIYNSFPVSLKWSDNQKEAVVSYNACETAIDGTEVTISFDGSNAYKALNDFTFSFGDQTEYTVTEFDIKFDGVEGHGMTMKNGGNELSNIRTHESGLAQQTSGSKWETIISANDFDVNLWYHVEFLFLNGTESGYHVYKYDDEGNKTLVKSMPNCNRRNDKTYNGITFSSGVLIDNFKVVKASANEIAMTASGDTIFPGDSVEYKITTSRNGLTMAGAAGITWQIRKENGDIYTGNAISINGSGLLTTTAMAPAGKYTIHAVSASGDSDEADLTIKLAEYFEVTNLGVDEKNDKKIVRIYAKKLLGYNDDVAFIIVVKDENGKLKGVNITKTFGDKLVMGDNEVTVDYTLPSDFDPASDKVEVMVWTSI